MKCNICQQERMLNALEIKSDEGNYTTKICDRCWDSIYQIAALTVKAALDPRTPAQREKDDAGAAWEQTKASVIPF